MVISLSSFTPNIVQARQETDNHALLPSPPELHLSTLTIATWFAVSVPPPQFPGGARILGQFLPRPLAAPDRDQ